MDKDFTCQAIYKNWLSCHKDTHELLESLTDDELSFKIKETPHYPPLGFHFGCILSTQKAYAKMLQEKKYTNDYYLSFKEILEISNSVAKLKKLLEEADQALEESIKRIKDEDIFNWGDSASPLWIPLVTLTEHERMHQGRLIDYFSLAKISLPVNFKEKWYLVPLNS